MTTPPVGPIVGASHLPGVGAALPEEIEDAIQAFTHHFTAQTSDALRLAIQHALGGAKLEQRECRWEYVESDGYWRGACGLAWCLSNDASLAENNMVHCPQCGGKLVPSPPNAGGVG